MHLKATAKKRISSKKPAPSYETFPMVHVKWLDASHSGADGWQTLDEVNVPILTAEACGFKVPVEVNKAGEKCLVLASALIMEEEGPPSFCVSFCIPMGMILEITEIKL